VTRSLLAAGDTGLAPSDRLLDVVDLLDRFAPAPDGPVPPGSPWVSGRAAVAEGMRRFALEHADALERGNAMGHFTGSGAVVDAAGERTLLMFHRKLQRWLQPGGHADGDANLVAVALKEAAEETGIDGLRIDPDPIDVDVHVIPKPHPGASGSHLHLDVRFLVVAPPGAVEVANDESEELRWVTAAELADERLGLDAGTIRLFRAAFVRFASRLS
jgi:8-oxo-dGTP pyrophosphatase MutT (NUDIX family)